MVTKKHKKRQTLKDIRKNPHIHKIYNCPLKKGGNFCLFATMTKEEYQYHMLNTTHTIGCCCEVYHDMDEHESKLNMGYYKPDPSGIIFKCPHLTKDKEKCPFTSQNGEEIYWHKTCTRHGGDSNQLKTKPIIHEYV